MGKVGPATSSATAFDRVTQHLDPGGISYFYWSLEKIVGHLTVALTTARDRALQSSLSPNEKEQFIDKSDLVIQLIRSSGIEGLLAFGGSSKQVENDLYLTKAFAYAPQPSGFIWQTFTKAPHRFAALDFLPANTEAFGLYDINLLALWQALLKDLATSRIQDVVIALNEFARQVHSNTGMTVDELLGSLGDEAGFVITLNQDAKVTIPLPNGIAEIPEPAGAIFWTVRDDRLFDRLDETLRHESRDSKGGSTRFEDPRYTRCRAGRVRQADIGQDEKLFDNRQQRQTGAKFRRKFGRQCADD